MEMPEVGNKIYIPFTHYANHNHTYCTQGGLATITKIYELDNAPDCMRYFIEVKEVSQEYNLKYLLRNQEEWKELYKDSIAEYDPISNLR